MGIQLTEREASSMRGCRGFTYILLLVVLATASILAGVTASVTSTYVQRDLEQELIFRGLQYRRAIESYYQAGMPRAYPRSLDDLLKDPRFVHRIHLRRRYEDPFERGSEDWLTVINEQGDIIGVASRSKKKPLKTANFPKEVMIIDGETSYQNWHFVYIPEVAPSLLAPNLHPNFQ